MFVTPAQLEFLTGHVQPAAQIRWLRKNGVRHYVSSSGKPRVLTADMQQQAPELSPTRPNFEALAVRH